MTDGQGDHANTAGVSGAPFTNAYADDAFAAAYADLQFPGTYYLAYRDIPAMLAAHATGRRALDFGCGAGRSTRFLREHGFEVVGVDIANDMLQRARAADPDGDYRLVDGERLESLPEGSFDVVFSGFTFDNVPTEAAKTALFTRLRELLAPRGRLINLVCSPDIYTHEWASFTTAAYPENHHAKDGDIVLIVNTAIADPRPVQDVVWSDRAYRSVYERSGLVVVDMIRPLATGDEPWPWVNETRIAPWSIYVLAPAGNQAASD